MTPFNRITMSRAPKATILIRLIVGAIFVSEGIQKFLFPATLGVGRFTRIGIPYPAISAPFVGGVEIVCGSLLIIGLLTRLAAIPLIISMSVAILSTKIPLLLGYGFWGFHLREQSHYGIWAMAHESRTDFAMFIGLLFLLIVGAGTLSFDALCGKSPKKPQIKE